MGDRVSEWQVGDRVMGIEAGGCYAEQLVTNARQAMPVPGAVPFEDAVAIPEVFVTAWDALVVQGGLTSGRWALVHAGASGVGTAAIQIAKAVGARVAVTCSAGKAEACRELGADIVLERSPADWLAQLRSELSAPRNRPSQPAASVDVVLDVIGGEEVNRNLRAVRVGGRIIQVGLMGGGEAAIDAGMLLAKRIAWIGTVLRGEDRPVPPLRRRGAAAVRPGPAASGHRSALPPRRDRRRAPADGVQRHRRQSRRRRGLTARSDGWCQASFVRSGRQIWPSDRGGWLDYAGSYM